MQAKKTRGGSKPRGKEAVRTQTAIRFPDELLERIDGYLMELREQVPGSRLTRADAIRTLVSLGLESVESKKRKGPDHMR